MTTAHPSAKPAVVVGVDGSLPSKHALRWAAFLATTMSSRLEIVAAWEPFTSLGWVGAGWATMPTDWDPAADAEKILGTTVTEVFGGDRPAGLQISVREGYPAKVLIEASEGATMLVIGSRGHGGFTGLLLGSVSAACAEHATCPVLIIHGETPLPGSTP